MSVDEPFYYVEPIENGLAHAIQIGDHQIMLIHRRRNYTGYSETPTTKGKPRIMSPKSTARLLKTVLTVATIVAYGTIRKTEQIMSDKIKDRYEEPKADSEAPETEQTD